MPENGDEIMRNFWYSFDYGSIHFITISFEHNFLKNSEQYKWLSQDLSKINKQITPWIVVSGHRPMYSSSNFTSDNIFSLGIKNELEDLLYDYKVDLFLSGHLHSYERTCKIYNNKCVEDGIIHILSGSSCKI
jgi:hypothetical protein